MSKQTLTQWFPADVKPVHVGVYQIHSDDSAFPNLTWHSYWNGKEFRYMACDGVNKAAQGQHRWAHYKQSLRWRGLAVKP